MERGHAALSVVRQCELLGVSRSSVYYEPVPTSEEDLEAMGLIDRQYLKTPFYGTRRMVVALDRQGHSVNRKRVQRLMRTMCLTAIYPKPRTSIAGAGHKIYPYLLRGLPITRANHVWATDITYIPMARGFVYLVAVIDWASRYVLSWRMSNTLDDAFCVDALELALARGRPEIFNSDQGSQFTGKDFTKVLLGAGVQISMDGKGRCLDNVFVERLWRSLKYEEVYLKAYSTVREAHTGIGSYLRFFNEERPHQALGNRTPKEVFLGGNDVARR